MNHNRHVRWLGRFTLRARLTILFALLLVAIAAFILGFFPARMEAQARSAARNRGVAIVRVIAAAAGPAVEFDDAVNAAHLLEWLASTPEATWAALHRPDGSLLATWHADSVPKDLPPTRELAVGMTESGLQVATPVRGLAGETGTLAVGFSLADLQAQRETAQATVAMATAGIFVIGLLVCAFLGTVLTAPIRRVTRTALAIAHDRAGAEAELTVGGDVEVAAMSQALDLMLRRLREQQTILASQSEASVEGILIASPARGVISFNRRFLELWTLDEAQLSDLDTAAAAVAERIADCDEARALFAGEPGEFPAAGGSERGVSGELGLADGRTLAYYVAPVVSPAGERFGTGYYFRDVTPEKRAANEIREMHARLLDVSRRAGMAEVATGILHNVGNVLNSINVSATLVHEKVSQSRFPPAVTKTGDLLADLARDPALGLGEHPRGRLVAPFLRELGGLLEAERTAVSGEIDSLVKNVEHVKRIVAMQNAYAKGGGVMETVSLSEVVVDAIQVHGQGLSRHDIELVREIATLPPSSVDRHRVLQILLNLLANAKHAMATNAGSKRLRVVTDRPQPDRMRVVVVDNGVGIAPENLARIFGAGFSTRRDGHGFGLHTSALAAQEMGGRLTCHSDGPGTGASFTLELPFQAAA